MTEVALPARHADQGARIRAARTMLGITEAELADALGSTTSKAVSRWESGENQPLYGLRHRLALVLGIPYHVLFVPEDVAAHLLDGPRHLLLTAHHRRGNNSDLYIETGLGAGRADASWLAKDWLVEYDGRGSRRAGYWKLTNAGQDVLDVLRADQ